MYGIAIYTICILVVILTALYVGIAVPLLIVWVYAGFYWVLWTHVLQDLQEHTIIIESCFVVNMRAGNSQSVLAIVSHTLYSSPNMPFSF